MHFLTSYFDKVLDSAQISQHSEKQIIFVAFHPFEHIDISSTMHNLIQIVFQQSQITYALRYRLSSAQSNGPYLLTNALLICMLIVHDLHFLSFILIPIYNRFISIGNQFQQLLKLTVNKNLFSLFCCSLSIR